MKKFYSLFAALFAATSLFAADVFEVRPCNEYGDSLAIPPSSVNEPLSTGDHYFNLRLVTRDNNVGTDPQANRYHFQLDYYNPASKYEPLMYPYRIGIVVSGKTKWATFVSSRPTPTTDQSVITHNLYDFVFKFTVEPGDFALPIMLAQDGDGNPVGIDDSGKPLFPDPGTEWRWNFNYYHKDGTVDSSKADLRLNTNPSKSGEITVDDSPDGAQLADISMQSCQLYAKTVDFQGRVPGETWKSTPEGEPTEGDLSVLDGTVAVTNAATFYIWSMDESVVVPVQGYDGTTWTDVKSETFITNYVGGVPQYGTFKVATVTIQAGQSIGRFKFKGLQRGKSADLVMSDIKGFRWNVKLGGVLIEDFLTATVVCTKPPDPYIDFDSEKAVTVDVPINQKQSVTSFDFKLSTAWTGGDGKVTVTVAAVPTVAGLQTNKYVRISDKDNTTTAWRNEGTVTFTLNTRDEDPQLTKPVYVYALGGDKNTCDDEHCFEFKVVSVEPAEAAAFYGTPKDGGTLVLKPQPPVVSTPAEGQMFTFTGEVTYELDFTVADNYANVQDTNTGYTVYWKQRSSDTSYSVLSNKNGQAALWRPDAEGVLREFANGAMTDLRPAVTYNEPPDDDNKSYFYIVAPNGEKIAPRTVYVTYQEPAAPPTVTPVALNVDEMNPDCEEGTNISVQVKLDDGLPYSTKSKVYAFLQLSDTNLYSKIRKTDNLAIEGARSSLVIQPKNTLSAKSSIVLDDGTVDGVDFYFEAVLCTTQTFSTNNVVAKYKPGDQMYVFVQNVQPTVQGVKMNSFYKTTWNESLGAYWIEQPVVRGQAVTFDVKKLFSEPSEKDTKADSTTPDTRFHTKFLFEEDMSEAIMVGNPNTTNVTHTFASEDGYSRVIVSMRDKDMNDTATGGDGEYGEEFEFYVHHSGKPTVRVVAIDGKKSFCEDKDDAKEVDPDNRAFRVQFSEKPTVQQTLLLTVTSNDPTSDNPGTMTLKEVPGILEKTATDNVYRLTVSAGKAETTISIDKTDGTPTSSEGFVVNLKVTTPDYEDYYVTEAGTFNILNSAPRLKVPSLDMQADYLQGSCGYQNASSNAYVVGANVLATPIKWNVSDISFDMNTNVIAAASVQTNLTVTWSVGGVEQLTTNVTDRTAWLTFSPDFSGMSGLKTVTVTVTDKDDGSTRASWYYRVESSKTLTTMANGPASSESALSQKYAAADGIGQGHIYSDATFSSATAHELTWNCGLSKVVNCYAWGYKATNRVDNGKLDGNKDIALDKNGDRKNLAPIPETDCYVYPDTVYDSFLYCWLQKISQSSETSSGGTKTSASSMSSVIFGTLAPERPLATATRAQVSMPTEEDEEGGYTPIMLEAIFSKEWLPADNMGDINADGIPDVYVSRYKFDVLDANGAVKTESDDLARLDGYNEDGDYLPAIGSATFANFIPALSNTWVTEGRKFSALLEIRGWGTNLNDAVNKPYVKITNVQPDINVTDAEHTTFSPLEWDAYVQAGKPAGWSPERPTDPTMLDTDDDGLPDGYEYYIWYKATVGYMDNDVNDAFSVTNGVHKYLTGRRYNPVDPSNPTVITPATIASKFDPLSPLAEDYDTMDTDWDGIPDSVEFMIGTNPLDYDTDGDGLPDGYEVEFSKTDPLKYASNDVICDADRNDDVDSMACYNAPMYVIGLVPAKTDVSSAKAVEYYCSEESFSNKVEDAAADCTRLDVYYKDAKGKQATNVYFTTVKPVNMYEVGGKLCLIGDLGTANTWTGRMVDGQLCRGEPVRLARGTLFNATNAATYAKETVVTNPPKYFVAFPYNGGYARGREVKGSLAGREVVASFTNAVKVLHYHVYQTHPYDPRTGWFHTQGSVETVPYTHMDELLSMTFWYNVGQLKDSDLIPTAGRSMTKIWTDFSTNPLNADTDGDRMPDGWEFYLMAQTDEQGPTWKYSPLENFNKLTTKVERDNDGDDLEWPQEYSGIQSSAQYGWQPTFPQWRNKTMPTDPWNKDTDGDGMQDGAEGGVGKAEGASTVAANFMYNTYGKAGGGLNPLSWDTDGDGLPDPWETEFHGTYKAGSTVTTTYEVFDDGSSSKTAAALATTTTVEQVIGIGATWNMDGMDGTVNDDRLDYDNDGLANWQEYMVGAMRCWRYDDNWSGWASHANSFERMPTFDLAEDSDWNRYWYDRLLNRTSPTFNPNLANGYFDPGVYFSCCTNAFDPVKGAFYMFRDGIYHDLADKLTSPMVATTGKFYVPLQYICCDPTKHDTDYDGMDDYYELFHGMNPLLGEPDMVSNHPTGVDNPYDVVYDAYLRKRDSSRITGAGFSATHNPWFTTLGTKHPETIGGYNFIICPWLNGIAGADPDGDNIVNQEEAIMPQVQAYTTYHHCDPTPLWMTDSSYTNSLTRRFYKLTTPAGFEDTSSWTNSAKNAQFVWNGTTYDLTSFPGFKLSEDKKDITFSYSANLWFVNNGWAYSFEENEGYDSDHDFLSDFEEAQGKTKPASNVLDHDDPLRRQAMYFNGTDAFLQTPVAVSETVPTKTAGTDSEEFFLYFTVECWAKPDAETVSDANKLHTLVARSVYADVSGMSDEKLMRRNFLIGVKNGRWYACFDGTSTDAKQAVEVANGPVASTEWTHVAATFDGKTLKLYVNGTCQGGQQNTSIQPEHGVNALAITEFGEIRPNGGTLYTGSSYISITVGAAPMTRYGLVYDYAWLYRNYEYVSSSNPLGLASRTTFDDYGEWYKGYIDEVRIWDGARSDSAIESDYANRTRYTTALAEANRREVYNQWKLGARRADSAELQLPPQLMYHFAFDHLAGAVLPTDLIKVPAGFNTAKTVTDAKARWCRPEDWVESDWANSDVRSTVYSDNWYVPWINNTVAHLPRFDTTTLDSVYWSEDYAGAVPASVALTNSASKTFSFPRSNEVYSRWTQMTYGAEKYYDSHYDRYFEVYNDKGPVDNTLAYSQKTRFNAITGYNDLNTTNDPDTVSTDMLLQLRFTSRERNIVGDDMLPMGGAYPRRISSDEGGMWDNKPGEKPSAADAWAETGKDSDNNGLPDWWEEYARANYCKGLRPSEPLEWGTTVNYYGVSMPAYQAYLRDLAKGLVKIGNYVGYKQDEDGNYIYADTRDNDKDGLPDWWEELYGLSTSVSNADDDPDNDGLSNYQEYLLQEVYPSKDKGYNLAKYGIDVGKINLNPTLAYSMPNQVVTDYFLAYTNEHVKAFGEKHFFLNEYFGEIVTDHDFMEDWWENFYNISYTSSKKYDPSDDKDGDGWSTWAECRASLWGGYFPANLLDQWTGSSSEQYVPCYPQPIIGVRATYYGEQDISGHQLVVRTTSGQTPRVDATFVVPQGVDAQTRYLGAFAGDALMHGQLSPGLINGNAIVFERALTGSEKTYYWNYNWYDERQLAPAWGWVYGSWQHVSSGNSGTFEQYRKEYSLYPHIELEGADLTWEAFVESDMSADGTTADLYIGSVEFGFVDCTTGEYELDMSKFSGEKPVDQYVFRVTYTSRLGEKWPQTVYLSDTKELQTGNTDVGTGNGYVREGKNTIEAFMDLNGDGVYTAGEPYGVVQNVDVGWHKIPVVTIELKDTSHVVPRFVVSADTDDRTVVMGAEASGSAFAASQNGNGDETGLSRTFFIRRKTINGESEVTTAEGVVKAVPQRTLATKTLVLDSRAYLTEADVLGGGGKFDLDAKWLKLDCNKLDIDPATVTSAGYDIEEAVTSADGSVSNVVVMSFENTFSVQRAKATVVSPLNAAPVYASSPTFAFSCADETMTAYRLQIRGADQNLVYDSEIQLLPGRVPNTAGSGVYEVTPPVYAGARVCSGAVTNAWFADGAEYEWRVALYNAKYPDDNLTDKTLNEKDVWSDGWAKFKMDVGNENRYPKIATGYGSLSLSVHYYGPTNVVAAGKDIYAEVFESGDFRGQPLARARVTLDETLSKRTGDAVSRTNAILRGIAPGKRFVRAFIDFNGNGQRDDWESWGYVNCVGKGVKAIYNPVAIDVTGATADSIVTEVAQHTLFIEDCDVDQNEIPDCMPGGLILTSLTATDGDGDGLADGVESNYNTNKGMWDTDSDAMPDGWEALFADTDPTVKDADEVAKGDVMAFAYVDATFVTISNAQSAATRYMLGDGEKVPERGKSVTGLSVWTTYDYPMSVGGAVTKATGVGTNLTVSGRVVLVEKDAKAVLVHNQVYDRFGFDATTATTADGAKNTKAFTALDKYLVIRYLDAQGKIKCPAGYDSGEDWVNRTGKWADYSLKPFDADNDADGIPDGWELYVGANPWKFADREDDIDHDGARLVDEYNVGNPLDPANAHTIASDILDGDIVKYQLQTAESQLSDLDNDGLSNWAEYLAYKKTGIAFDIRNAYTTTNVLDYFVKTADGKYVGESKDVDGNSLIADHDFMEDAWEDLWDPAKVFPFSLYANRYVYDANLDGDEDGWKNWSTCRAYHWGCGFYSDIIDTFITGDIDSQLRCFPQPAIGLKVTYNGRLDSSWKSLIVRTRTEGSTYPDAIFQIDSMRKASGGGTITIGTNATVTVGGMEKTQILGVYNGMPVMRGYLNPGLIVPSAAKFEMTPVSQELTYYWHCTECARGSGSYFDYKADITEHGEAKTDPNNKGVTLDETKPSQGWTTFATSGGGSDGRHGEIYLLVNNDLENKGNIVIGTIDFRTGEFSLDLGTLTKVYGYNFEGIAFRAVFTYNLGAYWPQTVWLSAPEKGYVKEGDNTIEAFLDLNENGRYDIGEPYGILPHVDIGWHKTPELRIELKDGTYNGVPLFEIESGLAGNNDDEHDKEQSTIDSQQATDGKVNLAKIGVDKAKVTVISSAVVEETGVDGGILAKFEIAPQADCKGRVRVDRLSVNGATLGLKRTVWSKTVDVTYGKVYTVADLIKDGQIDLDSKFLVADAVAAGIPAADIRTVEYAVCWGSGAPLYTFTRTFDHAQIAPELAMTYTNSYYKVLTAQPELTWTGRDGYGAFAVQVSEKADFSTVLYAATNILPAAGAYGCTFRPDLYVGEALKDKTTYYWRVAQLNAKFLTNAWSKVAKFETAVDSKNANTGYGKLDVEVRYFGPSTVALSNVVVGVYESGDFRCAPVARKHLAGDKPVTSLTNAASRAFTDVVANVNFDGIAPGEYYVMAFVDANGNGVRDAYETWGYVCKVATDEADLWTPVALPVVSTKQDPATGLIVMEDTDVNQDMIPDCLEDMTGWGVESADDVDYDGDGLNTAEEDEACTDPFNADTDGDGMDDGWEVKFGNSDPLTANADEIVGADDVMAFANLKTEVLVATNGAKKAYYAVREVTSDAGQVTNNVLYTTFDVGGTLYVGRVLKDAEKIAATNAYAYGYITTNVVAMHSAVYDFYGYDPTTARAVSNAANTVGFTAYYKYLTQARYLAEVGGANDFALAVGKLDSNGNYIPDGWELYVRYANFKKNAKAVYSDELARCAYGDNKLGIKFDPYSWMVEDVDGAPIDNKDAIDYRLVAVNEDGMFSLDTTSDYDFDGLSNYQEWKAKADLGLTLDVEKAMTDDTTPDYFRVGTKSTKYAGEKYNGAEWIENRMREVLGLSNFAREGTRVYANSGWSYWSFVRNDYDSLFSGVTDTDLTFVLQYLDAVVPGECSAKTLPELREFVHTKWAGVERDARQGDFWNDSYSYSYTYDEETGTTKYTREGNDDESVTWMTLVGDKLVTLDEMIMFFGGRTEMQATIDKNLDTLSTDDFVVPEPKYDLLVRYAGDTKYVLLVEAYQVNPAYPEKGEQLTAFWNTSAEFNAGLAKIPLATANSGSLKQGPARFVAFIDNDGDGRFSDGDTYGETTVNVGHLGGEIEITLGTPNAALPVIELTDGSNVVQSIGIVRTAINGVKLEKARGVYVNYFPNNVARQRLYPSDFVSKAFIGVDRFLAYDFDEDELERIESVEYAIVDGKGRPYDRTDYTTNVLTTFTVAYSDKRDKATVHAISDVLESNATLSFSVPTDTMNTKFWLKAGEKVYGGATGFVMPYTADGTVTIELSKYMGDLKSGTYEFSVALGNDKYGYPAAGDFCGAARQYVGKDAVRNAGFTVEVKHPTAQAKLTEAMVVAAYESADLAEPAAWKVVEKFDGNAIKLDGLVEGKDYYVAAWYVRNLKDGRAHEQYRQPYDTWGYVSNLGTNSTCFAARAVEARTNAGSTNVVWLQDTDFNDNLTVDREEAMTAAVDGTNAIDEIDPMADFDWDAIPDQADLDPVFPDDGDDPDDPDYDRIARGDLMAYKDVAVQFVAIGTDDVASNWTWYAVMDIENESKTIRGTDGLIYKQTPATMITSAATVYGYGLLTGVGTNVAFTAASGTVRAAEFGYVRLVHAQVFADCGFDTRTASRTAYLEGTDVNTKPFTRADKFLVPAYLKATGVEGILLDPFERDEKGAIVITNGIARIRKDAGWLVYWNDIYGNDKADADGDDIADGWELYTMFGIESEIAGVSQLGDFMSNPFAKYDAGKAHTLANAKISPFNSADAQLPSPGDAHLVGTLSQLGESVALTLVEEFDHGYWPTDPWRSDTDNDGVIDYYAYRYHLKADDAGKDFDGDGLSNYAEYLITEVFKFAMVDPDKSKTNGSCVDYFRKVGELYFGEIFTDHDQVDDQWEQGYETFANREVYDPSRDDDADGWSNWAEAKAGTHPGAVASPGVDGNVLPEYPIPAIEATVVYSGKQQLGGQLVFQAWGKKDTGMTGVPDAEWTVSSASAATNVTKYAGQNPGETVTYRLGPGVVSRGSVKVYFLDTAFEKVTIKDGKVADCYRGEVGDAQWYNFIQDYNGELYTSAITNGVLSQAQSKVGTVDYTTGEIVIDFGSPALQQVIYQNRVNGSSSGTDLGTNSSGVYYSHEKLDLGRSFVKLEWKPVMIATTGNATYCLADATGGKGHVLEGMNKFVVFCDLNTDGKYTPGEPFGFVRDVDVGWQGGAFTVELTETSPVFARIDLRATDASKASDRQVWQEGASTVTDISANNNTYNDLRKKMGVTCVGGQDLSKTELTRIRVMRVLVNGKTTLGVLNENGLEASVKRVVLDKYLDLGTRSYLHEGDFLAGSAFDCDWDTFQPDIVEKTVYESKATVGNPIFIDPTNVTYAIVLGEDAIGTSNLVFCCVVNKVFDYAGSREAKDDSGTPAAEHVIRPVIDSTVPQNLVYGARPTFRFAMKDGYHRVYNSYTAFNLKITGNGETYETGLRDLPPRDSTGWYEWTLDEPLGAKLPASGNYTWQVALYNAKFQGSKYKKMAVTEWSDSGTFVVNMNNQQPMNDHGYSSIAAAVKYAGPASALNVVSGCTYCGVEVGMVGVYVQAFATADFAGSPLGETFVYGKAELTNTSHNAANAWVKGLPQTGTYYLRAFIDSNGNGEKDDWESWGAAAEPVTISPATLTRPTVGIWIEDADTDGDWLPDAWEYANGGMDAVKNKASVIGDDKIVFSGTVNAPVRAGISTGLSGVSLTIFQNKSFILAMIPGLKKSGATISIDAIRKAVEKKVNPDTVTITALTLAPDGKNVSLSVAAEVTDSIAGELLGRLYSGLTSDTVPVTVSVYKKTTLAEDWPTTPVCTKTVLVGRDAAVVDVPVTGINMKSGFYKITVTQ